ncbi:MAG: hypothetical protein JRI59_10390 [Deltaproteobacteria bacterium]|nr:hypothetical protein [Deltaproteobacteria bacterium]
MRKIKKLWWVPLLLPALLLVVSPVWATVPGDVAAGLPLEEVIANGLGAGLTPEAILAQALDAGADPKALLKAAIARGIEPSRVVKFFMDRCVIDARLKELGVCTPCQLMRLAVEAGLPMEEAANALMAAGAKLEDVRACLRELGYPGAETYTYTPPAPPAYPVAVGPTFPGWGGGGVASPAR